MTKRTACAGTSAALGGDAPPIKTKSAAMSAKRLRRSNDFPVVLHFMAESPGRTGSSHLSRDEKQVVGLDNNNLPSVKSKLLGSSRMAPSERRGCALFGHALLLPGRIKIRCEPGQDAQHGILELLLCERLSYRRGGFSVDLVVV